MQNAWAAAQAFCNKTNSPMLPATLLQSPHSTVGLNIYTLALFSSIWQPFFMKKMTKNENGSIRIFSKFNERI